MKKPFRPQLIDVAIAVVAVVMILSAGIFFRALRPEKHLHDLRTQMRALSVSEGNTPTPQQPPLTPSSPAKPQSTSDDVTIDTDGTPILHLDLEEIRRIYGDDVFENPYQSAIDWTEESETYSHTPETMGTTEASNTATTSLNMPTPVQTSSLENTLNLRVVGWMEIPAIEFSMGITDVVSPQALTFASVLYPLSDHRPGLAGTSLLYTHRSHSQGGDFTRANELEVGDEMFLSLTTGEAHTYRLAHQRVVPQADYFESLFPLATEGDHLIVITCDPPGQVTRRIIQDFIRETP